MATELKVKFDIRNKSGRARGTISDGTGEPGSSYTSKLDIYGMEFVAPMNAIPVDGKITLMLGEKTLWETHVADLKVGGNVVDLENVINSGWTISVFLDYSTDKLGQYNLILKLRNE